ncbi:unnamed protein product, partial [Ectocarpus sp. 12 AP-2014]
ALLLPLLRPAYFTLFSKTRFRDDVGHRKWWSVSLSLSLSLSDSTFFNLKKRSWLVFWVEKRFPALFLDGSSFTRSKSLGVIQYRRDTKQERLYPIPPLLYCCVPTVIW